MWSMALSIIGPVARAPAHDCYAIRTRSWGDSKLVELLVL